MERLRSAEGTRTSKELMLDLFTDFEQLIESEGPGAADLGDLCEMKHKMTDAFAVGDCSRFLGLLAEAMSLRDGRQFDDSNAETR